MTAISTIALLHTGTFDWRVWKLYPSFMVGWLLFAAAYFLCIGPLRARFQNVTIAIKVTSDAPPEKLREVEQLALKGCPGIATLRDPVAVSTTLTVTAARQDAAVA